MTALGGQVSRQEKTLQFRIQMKNDSFMKMKWQIEWIVATKRRGYRPAASRRRGDVGTFESRAPT